MIEKSMNLYKMLQSSALQFSEENALISKTEHIRYKELLPKINILANFFLERGLRPGDRCAIVLRNSVEFVLTYFAFVKIGVTVVPINYLLKADEMQYIFNHAQVRGIITTSHFLRTVLKASNEVRALSMVVVTGDEEEFNNVKMETVSQIDFSFYSHILKNSSYDKESESYSAESDSLAMVLYTSGTTGNPKGVMLSHKNLLFNLESCKKAVNVGQKDSFLCILPMFHTFAWTVCVLLPLSIGAPVIIVESIRPFSEVIKAIFRHRAAVFVAVPQIYSALTKVPFKKYFKFLLPVKFCVSGAAPLPKLVYEKFKEKFGIPLIEGYGLTETSPVVSLNPLNGKIIPGSVGLPIPDIQVKIIDENGKTINKNNFVGELCVKGDNVMLGYYLLPKETNEAFLADGWLKTGDMGRIDENGYIYIVDRKKDLIIVRGFNVYSQEIENIIKEHPDVEDVAVIGIPDETLDDHIKAFVIPKPDRKPDTKELFKLCRKSLAVFKWPKEIIIDADLPRSSLGKILKSKLKERFNNKN
ncbi:MAG: long-chain-fatty-acid--CoA ligase [bacterium]